MQQVNLYQPSARKKWELFSLQMTTVLALLTALGLGGVYYMEYKKQQKIQQDLNQLVLQEETRLNRVNKLATELPSMKKSPKLERKLDLLKAERRQKLRVLSRLQDQSISNTKGFSSYLEGLARQRIPELWLTSIQILEGGEQLLLDGSALKADQVPRYLQRLSAESVYAGRAFHTFTLNRAEDERSYINFSIGTVASEDAFKP